MRYADVNMNAASTGPSSIAASNPQSISTSFVSVRQIVALSRGGILMVDGDAGEIGVGSGSAAPLTVADDLVVSLAYMLRLSIGEEIDHFDDKDPLQFIQGRGQIVPGLEESLYGMAVGDERHIVVEPADGYGSYDEEKLGLLPRDAFPADLLLRIGMGLRLREKETGEVVTVYVAELLPDSVVIDFNHPLAGETLYFHVRVVGLREATSEELQEGRVLRLGDVF